MTWGGKGLVHLTACSSSYRCVRTETQGRNLEVGNNMKILEDYRTGLINLLSHIAREHLPRVGTFHSVLVLLTISSITKMPSQIFPQKNLVNHSLTWGYRFQNDSTLCPVDIKLASILLFQRTGVSSIQVGWLTTSHYLNSRTHNLLICLLEHVGMCLLRLWELCGKESVGIARLVFLSILSLPSCMIQSVGIDSTAFLSVLSLPSCVQMKPLSLG